MKTLCHGSGDAAKCGFVCDISVLGNAFSRNRDELKDLISEDYHLKHPMLRIRAERKGARAMTTFQQIMRTAEKVLLKMAANEAMNGVYRQCW